MSVTTDIPCKFDNRQWMRAAKAFRCFFALPDNQVLAAALTKLIDRKVKATILAPDGMHIEIDPVLVVDVPKKGRHYQLVIETCYEQQKKHGPYLTLMAGQSIRLSLSRADERSAAEKKPPAQRKVGPVEISGLHSCFFKNPKFQRFVATASGSVVGDEHSCKKDFKALHNIQSTKDLDLLDFRKFLNNFNEWTKRGA